MKSATASMLCAALVVAQQPPAPAPNSPQPEVVFSVTTALVQVDAVVTDSKGHHVTDLAADDFAVYEDGKPQKITHFSYVRVSPQTPVELKSQLKRSPKSAVLPPAPAAPPRREDIGRTIALIVDDLGISFESMAFVRYSLRKFVERQMQPGDLVALCRTGSGSGVLFTVDKRILLSLIDGLRWNANASLALFEPYGKYSALAEQLGGVPSPRGGNADFARTDAYNAQRTTVFELGTLAAITNIIAALREMPGRKSIVLFSDGMPGWDGSGMRKLMDSANRAGTVIYTMHTAGLQPLQIGAEDRVDLSPSLLPVGEPSGERELNPYTHIGEPGGRDAAFNKGQQGLASLAWETGGVPYENGNDLNWGLQRVLDDQQGYYLIGFKPPSNTFDEKHGSRSYHHITIRVNRPGLHVRSRSGFYGETDDQTLTKYLTPLEQMRAAMLSPFHSSGVRLRLTALYAEIPKRGPVVRNLLHIDAQDLTFQLAADGSATEVEIVAVATRNGRSAVGRRCPVL